ncbi:hypothetical protein TNCV_3846001 [Trichonephila clavipes]|nr:hypothetical protein TNCV_3846001 [Trichonephila clavipes]
MASGIEPRPSGLESDALTTSPQIWRWDVELVARYGMGSENGKSLVLVILFRTMEQNYLTIVLRSVLDKSDYVFHFVNGLEGSSIIHSAEEGDFRSQDFLVAEDLR